MADFDPGTVIMNMDSGFTYPPKFSSIDEERLYCKQRLAAACRLFGKFGFDEGAAGHITVRDPEFKDTFWVNPLLRSFKQMRVSDLIRVNHSGEVVEGKGLLNGAAFAIHSRIHMARPDVNAAAHSHATYGRSWSSLGRELDPITQDSCAFWKDHAVFQDFTGVVLDGDEGKRIAETLGKKKALILRNHGLLTVGTCIDSAAWWYITMERTCQVQLMAEAAGKPVIIDDKTAEHTYNTIGSEFVGWASFQPLYSVITEEQPALFN